MLTAILSICGYDLLLSSCSHDDDLVPNPVVSQKSIVIIFENDVHCAIDGYKRIAGLRDAIISSDTAWAAAQAVVNYFNKKQGISPSRLCPIAGLHHHFRRLNTTCHRKRSFANE